MSNRNDLLRKLLQALVDEWGIEAVSAALTCSAEDKVGYPVERPEQSARTHLRNRPLTAKEQVERETVLGPQRSLLLQLADRYDHKEFLPSVADVREFLVMAGKRPTGLKDRREAFRVLLQALLRLPTEHLEELTQTALHSGPAELGPLSDAIARVGANLTRYVQPREDDRA